MNISLAGYRTEDCWLLVEIDKIYREECNRPLEEVDIPFLLYIWGTARERFEAQQTLRALINTMFDEYFDELRRCRDTKTKR